MRMVFQRVLDGLDVNQCYILLINVSDLEALYSEAN